MLLPEPIGAYNGQLSRPFRTLTSQIGIIMTFLIIDSGGSLSQLNVNPTQDDLQMVNDGDLTIIRFNSNAFRFEAAVVKELEPEGEDEETEFEIAGWQTI